MILQVWLAHLGLLLVRTHSKVTRYIRHCYENRADPSVLVKYPRLIEMKQHAEYLGTLLCCIPHFRVSFPSLSMCHVPSARDGQTAATNLLLDSSPPGGRNL